MATMCCGSVYLTTMQQNTPPHHMQRCYRLLSHSKSHALSRWPRLSAAVHAAAHVPQVPCTRTAPPAQHHRSQTGLLRTATVPVTRQCHVHVPGSCLLPWYQPTLPRSDASNTSHCSNSRYRETCCHRPSRGVSCTHAHDAVQLPVRGSKATKEREDMRGIHCMRVMHPEMTTESCCCCSGCMQATNC